MSTDTYKAPYGAWNPVLPTKRSFHRCSGLDLMYKMKATSWCVSIYHTIARPPRFCLIFTNQKRLCKACDDEEVGIPELNLI